MGGPLSRFDRRFRYFIVGILSVLGLCAIGVSTQIGPLTEPNELLPEDHPLYVVNRLILEEFVVTKQVPHAFMVSIVWGVKDLDRSNVGLWDPSELGELVWDEEFDIAPALNQRTLLNLCDELTNDQPELVKDSGVKCWIQNMDTWLRKAKGKQLPIEDSAEFTKELLDFAKTEVGLEYQR